MNKMIGTISVTSVRAHNFVSHETLKVEAIASRALVNLFRLTERRRPRSAMEAERITEARRLEPSLVRGVALHSLTMPTVVTVFTKTASEMSYAFAMTSFARDLFLFSHQVHIFFLFVGLHRSAAYTCTLHRYTKKIQCRRLLSRPHDNKIDLVYQGNEVKTLPMARTPQADQ